MARKTYRRRRSRRRAKVSTSVVTYQRQIRLKLNSSSTAYNVSTTSQAIDGAENTSGETVNRKIVGVRGTLSYACQPAAGEQTDAMFALWAHPRIEDFPSGTDFDPFDAGPGGARTTYDGRPTPRPFCRKYFSHILQESGTSTQFFQQHNFRSRAQRLLRPGWILTAGLWVRSSAASQKVALGGIISVVVEN